MAYGKSKNLVKRTQSDKVLKDKAFKIASDPKYDGYQRGLASMVYKFLIKNSLDQGSEFYNNSFKDFLRLNNIEMYSTYNEGKSVVAERFIRTLKNRIFKDMTDISKKVYFYVLDVIVNKYINTVHRTIKMKPIDVTDNTYIDFKKWVKDKDPKFEVGDRVKNAKYKTFLLKDTLQINQKKLLLLVKLKTQFLGLMLLMI